MEEVGRRNSRKSRNKRSQSFSEFILLPLPEVHRIHRDYDHGLPCFLTPTDNEMSPKTDIGLHVIGRESILSSKSIKSTKYFIHYIIPQNTVGTIHDTIKLARFMKSKSVFVVHSFSSRDIFSPTKFYFITVTINLWRAHNRMPCGILYQFRIMNKDFSDLLFFHFELFLVWDWEPSATSIHLEIFWEFCFQRRFLDDTKNLPFYAIRSIFEDTNIYCTLRNSPTRDENFFTRWITTETNTSENQFFNKDTF